ncbi:MAG TPA: hypothetical protein VHV51_12390 [Polyangiaceae bacterium]|nr:hypothetical protein [Polyangiaceae bacterium]
MSKIETTQLLVAGGGPVGLFAALCAARRGLELVVIASPLGVQSMNRGIAEVRAYVEEVAGERADSVARLERLGSSLRQSWLSDLGDAARFDLLPHAPVWLSGHAKQLAVSLPVSGMDLEESLRQLGLKRGSAA